MTFDRTSEAQCPPDEAFDALMRGALTDSERGVFHTHVDRCTPCQQLLRELASSIDVEAELEGSGVSVYRLQARLGQGGMGVVYRAADVQLDRNVALKLPPRREPGDRGGRGGAGVDSTTASWHEARFLREALLTARLQHPGIVPIHQVGRWPNGDVFYTMKLISGRSLQELIGAARDLDERLALLPHVLAAAEAVGYAHAQGVIHRDLKPANIMCGPFGETVVIDWGLAKQLDAQASEVDREIDERARLMTGPGLVLGTPSYMAPEQARGDRVDTRADVFALGAIVHHLLAGTAPVRTRAAHWPPGAPPDLIALARKATALDPDDRYATAKQLADDLRRFQTGQLVGARIYSTSTLVWRWVLRHRSSVLLALLFAGVLVATGLFSVRRIVREQRAATASRNDLAVLQARSALADDPTSALGWLKVADGPKVDWARVRSIAEDALGRGVARHVLRGHDGPVGSVVVAPGGDHVASLGRDGAVWLWSRSTGQGWMVLYQPGLLSIAFSADGATLAASGRNGVKLYSLATGAQCALREAGAVTALAMGPDPRTVVTGSANGTVALSRCDGSAMRVLGSHADAVNAIAVSPRGDAIASASADGTVAHWTLASGASRVLRGHDGEVNAIAFRGDGDALVSGGADATVRIWSPTTAEARILRGHSRLVNDVKFSPSGSMVASGSGDMTVILWDAATGDRRTLPWDQVPWVVAFSPGGDRLAAAGLGGQVRIWDIAGRSSFDLRGHKGAVYDAVFSSDDGVITAGEDGSVRVWEHARPSASHSEIDDAAYDFAVSGDGAALALGGVPTQPSVRLRSSDGATRVLGQRTGGAQRLALSADGRRLAAFGRPDRNIALWDIRTGASIELRGHDDAVEDLAFSPDGARLASAGLDGTVRLWETDSGRERTLRGHSSWVYSIAFSPDGKQLVSGGRDGTVRLWDLATGVGRILMRHLGQVRVVRFSRDGKLVASGDLVSGVGIVTLATGSARILAGHDAWVYDVAFSPDGRSLVSGSADGTVRLWTAPWNTSQVLVQHDGPVRAVRFSPDGATVASASNDTTVRVASIASGATRVLHGHCVGVLRVAFAPDGTHLLSSDNAGKLIRWSAPVLTDSPPSTSRAVAAWLAQLTSAVIESRHQPSTQLSAPMAAGPGRP